MDCSDREVPTDPTPPSYADASEFNTLLRRLTTPKACAQLFRQAISTYGFDTFSCGEVDLNNRERCVFYIIDWTERWRRFYFESGLVHRDPLLEVIAFRDEPFTWSDLRADQKLAKVGTTALDLAAEEGWVEGLVVPLSRGGGRIGIVSMAGHQKTPSLAAKAFLCLISVCLYGHVRSLVAREGFAVPPVGLTSREIACVELVAKGYSDNAIAIKLGVAPSTAHEFVEKAKRRLKTKSRPEMVAVAVSLGIIDV
jgi:DNA-binding CsgD family transcriptional regulator